MIWSEIQRKNFWIGHFGNKIFLSTSLSTRIEWFCKLIFIIGVYFSSCYHEAEIHPQILKISLMGLPIGRPTTGELFDGKLTLGWSGSGIGAVCTGIGATGAGAGAGMKPVALEVESWWTHALILQQPRKEFSIRGKKVNCWYMFLYGLMPKFHGQPKPLFMFLYFS